MHHAAVHVARRVDDLPAGTALDVADEADPAGILLLRRVVEPLSLR